MPALALRLAGYQPARSVLTRAMRVFEAAMRRRLDGRIDFHFIENIADTGRKAVDLFAMTEGDELDICYFSSSYLAARVPSLGLFDVPFHVTDRSTAYALTDGPTGRRLAEDVAAATGFAVLAYWDNGFRHITNVRRPIVGPHDCVGLRIRTLDNVLYQRVLRAMGFEPIVIDVKDLSAAVRERRVDAQENPLTNVLNFDLHKTHRFLTLTGHFFGVALVLCNRARLAQWPQDVRDAVTEAMAEATEAQRRYASEDDEACLAALLAAGVEVVPARQIDHAGFFGAVADIRSEAMRAAGIS
jgi:C4-dicarboxylate-binding protein DctP